MTPAQCSAGRILLRLSPRDLGKLAGLMGTAVSRFESGGPLPLPSQRKLQAALEAAGVEFTAEEDGKAWVRLTKPS